MKGATISTTYRAYKVLRFNPRSHEGSDYADEIDEVTGYMFQSTLPWRERLWYTYCDVVGLHVSIHAPMKGATFNGAGLWHDPDSFNPRSHEGSDSNFSQKSSLFSARINNLFRHYKLFFLLSLFFLQKPLDFVHIYRCESPCIFMFNPYSHTLILS